MSPFQPIGERARWRLLYDVLRPLQVNDTVTYEQLAAVVGMDPDAERPKLQMTLRRAAREFEEVDKHALEVIPNVGYRVVTAPEHLTLARKQQKRANKALVRGHSKVVNVDFNEIDPETRKAFEVVARAFSMQMEFNRRFDIRQRRLEAVVETVSTRAEKTDEELERLRERLARLEQATNRPSQEESA